MSMVTLVSGGLDSTLMAVLAKEEGVKQYPLFIDYGQLGKDKEFHACCTNLKRHGLPEPEVASLGGYGSLLSSGLTDPNKHIVDDVFLPCRNLMFLTVGAAYAFQCGADRLSIGLLDEAFHLFPDQTKNFISDTEALLSKSLGKSINVIAPLMSFSKADVVAIAKTKNVVETYSCHAGTETPCGVCVACREYIGLGV